MHSCRRNEKNELTVGHSEDVIDFDVMDVQTKTSLRIGTNVSPCA